MLEDRDEHLAETAKACNEVIKKLRVFQQDTTSIKAKSAKQRLSPAQDKLTSEIQDTIDEKLVESQTTFRRALRSMRRLYPNDLTLPDLEINQDVFPFRTLIKLGFTGSLILRSLDMVPATWPEIVALVTSEIPPTVPPKVQGKRPIPSPHMVSTPSGTGKPQKLIPKKSSLINLAASSEEEAAASAPSAPTTPNAPPQPPRTLRPPPATKPYVSPEISEADLEANLAFIKLSEDEREKANYGFSPLKAATEAILFAEGQIVIKPTRDGCGDEFHIRKGLRVAAGQLITAAIGKVENIENPDSNYTYQISEVDDPKRYLNTSRRSGAACMINDIRGRFDRHGEPLRANAEQVLEDGMMKVYAREEIDATEADTPVYVNYSAGAKSPDATTTATEIHMVEHLRQHAADFFQENPELITNARLAEYTSGVVRRSQDQLLTEFLGQRITGSGSIRSYTELVGTPRYADMIRLYGIDVTTYRRIAIISDILKEHASITMDSAVFREVFTRHQRQAAYMDTVAGKDELRVTYQRFRTIRDETRPEDRLRHRYFVQDEDWPKSVAKPYNVMRILNQPTIVAWAEKLGRTKPIRAKTTPTVRIPQKKVAASVLQLLAQCPEPVTTTSSGQTPSTHMLDLLQYDDEGNLVADYGEDEEEEATPTAEEIAAAEKLLARTRKATTRITGAEPTVTKPA
jgi:hypothetical protein